MYLRFPQSTETTTTAPAPSWEWQATDARVNPTAGTTHDWWNVDPHWFQTAHPPPPPPQAPTQLVLEQVAVAHTAQKLQHKIANAVTIPSTTSTSTTSTEHVSNQKN